MSNKVLEEGNLKGSFTGFRDRDTIFEFTNGRKWRQDEYKYHYHYAYRPRASIVEDRGVQHIRVDGMNVTVRVIRVR